MIRLQVIEGPNALDQIMFCAFHSFLDPVYMEWWTRSSGVGFFCFVYSRAWKQKKPTPLDRGPPLHVNRPLVEVQMNAGYMHNNNLEIRIAGSSCRLQKSKAPQLYMLLLIFYFS